MADEQGAGTVSLDRYEYLVRAGDSLEAKYEPGFWTWLRENKPIEYELIQHEQERIDAEDKGGTTESFKRATHRWWGRIAAGLLEYSQNEEAKAKYGQFI